MAWAVQEVRPDIVNPLYKRTQKWYNKNMSKSKDLRETARVFGVVKSTVHRWVKQYEETGDL